MDNQTLIVLLVVLIFVGLILAWLLEPNPPERKFDGELEGRESLSDAEMASRYFAASGIPPSVPSKVRNIFASNFGYVADKLLPDDDFSSFYPDLDHVELVRDIEKGFGIAITVSELEQTPYTIRSVSQLVAKKLT